MAGHLHAADKLVGLHSAQVLSQSMPWIAQEAGLFKKHDIEFRLVFISSSPIATAATMGGDAEVAVTGAVGNVRAYVQGATDLVFIGGIKNLMTHSILGKPEFKRPEDLRGKKVGVGRFGGNTHYFVIQALRRFGMDASRDIQTIQTGGGPDTLAALVGGSVEAAALVAPGMPPPSHAATAISSMARICAFRMAQRQSLRCVRSLPNATPSSGASCA